MNRHSLEYVYISVIWEVVSSEVKLEVISVIKDEIILLSEFPLSFIFVYISVSSSGMINNKLFLLDNNFDNLVNSVFISHSHKAFLVSLSYLINLQFFSHKDK